jgi:putative tryptophan/tyrosine transport system substrate-binding protein
MPNLRRRQFITLLGGAAAAWPLNGLAQTPPKPPLIGFLMQNSTAASEASRSGFAQGMRELGYLENRDYVLEERYAGGDRSRLPPLAEELVRLKPELMVVGGLPATLATKEATTSIPIVGVNVTDPIGTGLVASEARPGTNVTGSLVRVEGLTGKQLEIARDVMPSATKIGVLINADNPSNRVQWREAESAAAKLGLSLAPAEVRTADEVGAAFQMFVRERANIVVVFADPMLVGARRRIAAFALATHLPTVGVVREQVEDGGLISYGIHLRQTYRRAAYYADRILKGAKPADLPIEFPTSWNLSSISQPPTRSASKFRRRCSRAPTR